MRDILPQSGAWWRECGILWLTLTFFLIYDRLFSSKMKNSQEVKVSAEMAAFFIKGYEFEKYRYHCTR
jgi:hypothetical protein